VSQGSGRYQRSAAGMVGAMIVTLLAIVAFVAFRAINRDDLVIEPTAVDYLETVEALQQGNDLDPAYPPTLPEGWIATRAVFSADNLAWELDVLTDEEKYIGIRQAAIRDKDLIEEYVDEDGRAGEVIGIDSGVATEWRTWSVDGSDIAYTAPLGIQRGDDPSPDLDRGKGQTVLVFGAATDKEITALAASLVQDRVGPS
jgi:hypothetical protein